MAWLLPIHYENSDDVLMCQIANGTELDKPDCHLVFINAIYGTLVAALYRLTSIVEWYTILFSLLHILSISVIVYSIYKTTITTYLKALIIIFVYVYWIAIIQSMQFTTTAGLTTLAGCILLLSDNKINVAYGLAGVFIGSLIRFDAAALTGIIFTPVFFIYYKTNYKKYVSLVAITLFVFITKSSDKLFYQTDKLKYYYEYNHIRGKINDNPNAWRIEKKELHNIGITEEDFMNLMDFIPDPEIITLPVIKQIHNIIDDVPITKKIKNIKQLKPYACSISLIIFSIIFFLLCNTNIYTKIMLALLGSEYIAILFMLSLNTLWTVKLRMFYLINIVMIISLIQIINSIPKVKHLGLSICLILLITLQIKNIYVRYTTIGQKTEIWNTKKQLLQAIPNNGYVIWVWDQYLLNPFHIKEFHTKLYPWVWLTNFPMSNQQVGTSHRSFTNNNVFFCVPVNQNGEYDCFNSYLSRKYGINTTPTVFKENDEYALVQLKLEVRH